MSRRSKKHVSFNPKKSLVPALRNRNRPVFPERRYEVAGSILRVTTYLPRSVVSQTRREIYPYPYPNQKQKRGRAIRLSLRPARGPYVKATVRIRMPRRLPVARGSYVSLSRNMLNIHSTNQVERTINAQEFNRRRYSEYKSNHRKGRNGQLDSPGSTHLGIVAHAYRRGHTIDKIGDAAMVARAIANSKRKMKWR